MLIFLVLRARLTFWPARRPPSPPFVDYGIAIIPLSRYSSSRLSNPSTASIAKLVFVSPRLCTPLLKPRNLLPLYGSRRSITSLILTRQSFTPQEATGSTFRLSTRLIETMSTTYQAPLAAYESHAMHGYPSSLVQVGRNKVNMADAANPQIYRPPMQQPHLSQHQLPSNWPSKEASFSGAPTLMSNSQQITRPPSPASSATLTVPQSNNASRRGSESLVYHSLDIPRRISPNGGNLADFAAQVGFYPSPCRDCLLTCIGDLSFLV